MDNRQRLLVAARQIYAQHGFRGATTRRIAREAGVNEVTLFRLFGSKARLFAELRHAAFDPEALPALPEVPGAPERELTDWCAVLLAQMTAERSMLRKLMSELEEDPDAARSACAGPSCAARMLERYVITLQADGQIAPDADVATSVSMFMSALFGDAMTREMIPDSKPQPFEEAPRRYVRAFLRSLGRSADSFKPERLAHD